MDKSRVARAYPALPGGDVPHGVRPLSGDACVQAEGCGVDYATAAAGWRIYALTWRSRRPTKMPLNTPNKALTATTNNT